LNCGSSDWIEEGGLSHSSNMGEKEHEAFVKCYQNFKQQTDFENEFSPIMLKYYVQMAYLEGWRKSSLNEH